MKSSVKAVTTLIIVLSAMTTSCSSEKTGNVSPELRRNAMAPAAQASEECPGTGMDEAAAQSRALAIASQEGFESAAVTDSSLVTPELLRDAYGIVPAYAASCYWHVEMSGLKINSRWPPGMPATPTPGPSNTFVELEIAMDFESGYLAAKRFSTIPIFTPTLPTPGSYPTLMLPPTALPAPPTPPTS